MLTSSSPAFSCLHQGAVSRLFSDVRSEDAFVIGRGSMPDKETDKETSGQPPDQTVFGGGISSDVSLGELSVWLTPRSAPEERPQPSSRPQEEQRSW
jgi:hypothetical protein